MQKMMEINDPRGIFSELQDAVPNPTHCHQQDHRLSLRSAVLICPYNPETGWHPLSLWHQGANFLLTNDHCQQETELSILQVELMPSVFTWQLT